ncbi:MAG: hypothetical protein J6Z38_01760 [Lachnospiraceae bacterium]|nr:hypothetical protein [Lachnospiraceae bacterium]
MTIEKRNVKEERFFAWNLGLTALLMIVLYLLIHSAVFFDLLAARLSGKAGENFSAQQLHRLLRYMRDALWGYGLVMAMSSIFHRTKDQLKAGLLIVLGFEALLLLAGVLFLTQTAMDPFVYFAVIFGNSIAALAVLIHERVLL